MSKRRRRKLAMARRRKREHARRQRELRRDAGLIRALGDEDGTAGGRSSARFGARRLRAPATPSVVDDAFLGAAGPRLLSYRDMRRLVVSDPLRGTVERWFALSGFARGVAADPESGGLVVFGSRKRRLTGSRWDPELGLEVLDPVDMSVRAYACDRAGDRIHAAGDEGLVSWRYGTGRKVQELAWDLPALPEYHGWALVALAAVPGTHGVAALFVKQEAFSDRDLVRGYRLVSTDASGERVRAGTDLSPPPGGEFAGVAVFPPGTGVSTPRDGPLASSHRLPGAGGAVAVVGRAPLRRGRVAGRDHLLVRGFTPEGWSLAGTYLVDPGRGRASRPADLPAAWGEAPELRRELRRGFVRARAQPRLVVGERAALVVEDLGPVRRLSRLAAQGCQVLAELEDTRVGGLAVDEEAGELVANLRAADSSSSELACWDLDSGAPRPARETLPVAWGSRALSPEGRWALGFDADGTTLMAQAAGEASFRHRIPGPPRPVEPGWPRRCWVAPGGGTVLLSWRAAADPASVSLRRVLLPEGDAEPLEGRPLEAAAFDPTGTRAALVIGRDQVLLWGREAPAPEPTGLDLGGVEVSDLAFTPDGRFLLVAPRYGDGELTGSGLWLWDLRERARVGTLPVPEGAPAALSFSRDGRWLYLVVADGAAMVWEAEAVLAEARRRGGHLGGHRT